VFQNPIELGFSNSPFEYSGLNHDLHYQCHLILNIFIIIIIKLPSVKCSWKLHRNSRCRTFFSRHLPRDLCPDHNNSPDHNSPPDHDNSTDQNRPESDISNASVAHELHYYEIISCGDPHYLSGS
jgi:hypothetical protein